MLNPHDYVQKYYDLYADGGIDREMEIMGSFLAENVRGIALDCGCGPVPQLWSIFMPNLEELHAIDLPQESIDFVKRKMDHVSDWYRNFFTYQEIVEKRIGKLSSDYILKQVAKLKSIQQADMSSALPFPDQFFDTVMSLYSLGCLKSEDELRSAIANMHRVLKPGGTFLHINTNVNNKNDILPAYTGNGLNQTTSKIESELKNLGFFDIEVNEIYLGNPDENAMYKYDGVMILKARKK